MKMKLLQAIRPKLKLFARSPKKLAFISGVLSVAVLPPHSMFWLGFLSFPILLLLINSAGTKKNAFAVGYWFGYGYFACNMAWIGNALLIDAARFGWLYPLTLAAAGGFFGLFVAFPALLSRFFNGLPARYLSFSAFWVLFEWIRSFIFTGFPWNLLGSSLSFSDTMLQAAALIGTYGLSLLVLMIFTAPALYMYSPSKKRAFAALLIPLSLSATAYGYGFCRLKQADTSPSDLAVRIVQPSIPQAMKWNSQKLEDNFAEYIKLSQAPGLEKTKIVIWGETATPFPLDFEPRYLAQIARAVPPQGYLITGLVRYQYHNGEFRPLNSMFAINDEGKIAASYDKSHLVPFGEYIPLRSILPEWIRPVTNAVTDFLPGSGPSVTKLPDIPGFGTLICYEIIFPHRIISSDNRPNWLINLTNDGWYGHSQGPYQHLVTTRLRALEEGRTIVRAANSGISAVISPYGKIIASLGLDKKGWLDANLPKQMFLPTIYGRFGNLIPLILCLMNIGFAFFMRLPLR